MAFIISHWEILTPYMEHLKGLWEDFSTREHSGREQTPSSSLLMSMETLPSNLDRIEREILACIVRGEVLLKLRVKKGNLCKKKTLSLKILGRCRCLQKTALSN